jgi:hypothetical protein
MPDLLDTARTLMERPDLAAAGVWQRAAAFLARQELEASLIRLWVTNLPGVERSSTTTQLACLEYLSPDPDLAADVRAAWNALSRACHHHQYELAPTAPELAYWITQVEHLSIALKQTEARAR